MKLSIVEIKQTLAAAGFHEDHDSKTGFGEVFRSRKGTVIVHIFRDKNYLSKKGRQCDEGARHFIVVMDLVNARVYDDLTTENDGTEDMQLVGTAVDLAAEETVKRVGTY